VIVTFVIDSILGFPENVIVKGLNVTQLGNPVTLKVKLSPLASKKLLKGKLKLLNLFNSKVKF